MNSEQFKQLVNIDTALPSDIYGPPVKCIEITFRCNNEAIQKLSKSEFIKLNELVKKYGNAKQAFTSRWRSVIINKFIKNIGIDNISYIDIIEIPIKLFYTPLDNIYEEFFDKPTINIYFHKGTLIDLGDETTSLSDVNQHIYEDFERFQLFSDKDKQLEYIKKILHFLFKMGISKLPSVKEYEVKISNIRPIHQTNLSLSVKHV
jgi:hypothetical protein